ncbi:MAG: hypothetical protein ACYCRH_03520 [Acidiferrobacteraceae bacterium]
MRHNAEVLSPFIAPILVYEGDEQHANNWLTGGTVFFALTTENRFLVTADHVMRAIDALRQQHPIRMMLCGHACAPVNIAEWSVIARDSGVDICTLQVPGTFNPEMLNKRFFELANWPHPQAQVLDKAFIIGYPAEHRSGSSNDVQSRITPICDFVSDVGPRCFTMADQSEEREVLLNPENLSVPEHFGGMSGSPVLRMIENSRPELIGILSEGGGGLGAPFFCAHANFILSNGSLDIRRMPP